MRRGVFVELRLQRAQLHRFGCGVEPLGADHAGVDAPLGGFGKKLESLFISLRALELVRVQELLPLALASLAKGCGTGKALDKGPGRDGCPVIEGLQCGGVVFAQGLAQLVDERGAFLDQRDHITAKDAQLFNDRIFGAQGTLKNGVPRQGRLPAQRRCVFAEVERAGVTPPSAMLRVVLPGGASIELHESSQVGLAA